MQIDLNAQEQQLLRAICDAALRNQGISMMQPVAVILAKLADLPMPTKKGPINVDAS